MDSSGGELLSGHVLGLGIEQAKVAVTFAFLFLLEALEGFHVFVRCFGLSEAMVVQQHAAAASEYMDEQSGVCKDVSALALQAMATARVDVPETSKMQGQAVELEEKVPVFLRTLQGRHHVTSCTADMLIADLHEDCATLTLSARLLGGSGIPGAIGVGAGTPRLGASGVQPAVRRVRPFCVVLLRGFCGLATALARAKELGKGVVPRLKESSAIQEGWPLLPDLSSLMPPHSKLLVRTSANRRTLHLLS